MPSGLTMTQTPTNGRPILDNKDAGVDGMIFKAEVCVMKPVALRTSTTMAY
jgi:hypothetical protein